MLLQEGTSTIGFSDYTQELSVEELWMCRVFFNERLNFANVLDVACLQSDMALAPTPMNVLAEELQMHLFRLSPVFMSELFGNPCVLDHKDQACCPREVTGKWQCAQNLDDQLAFVVPSFLAKAVCKRIWRSIPWHASFRCDGGARLFPNIPNRRLKQHTPSEREYFPVLSLTVQDAQSLYSPSSFLNAASQLQRWRSAIVSAVEAEGSGAIALETAKLNELIRWCFASAAASMSVQTTETSRGLHGYRYTTQALIQCILLTSKLTNPLHLRNVLLMAIRLTVPAAVSACEDFLANHVRIPSKAVLHRARVCLDVSHMLLHRADRRRIVQKAGQNLMDSGMLSGEGYLIDVSNTILRQYLYPAALRFTLLDASPQAGKEYLLCETITIEVENVQRLVAAQDELVSLQAELLHQELDTPNPELLGRRVHLNKVASAHALQSCRSRPPPLPQC